MARIKKPHGCYYKAINILHSWGNTIYLANDLREIIQFISDYYDDEEEIRYEGRQNIKKLIVVL